MLPITIAGLVAAIAGAGMQYKASSDAQERQRREIAASLEAQRKLQMQAEAKAMGAAQTYETPKRAAEQEQIAANIEQSLIQPVSESQAIRAEQQTTQGNVSDAYSMAKAKSDLETVRQAEQLARLLGKTTSASRLRMNEGIRLMDTGQDIDRLAGFSRGQFRADDVAIQQAGQLDPTKMFVSSLLRQVGTAGMMAPSADLTAAGAAAKYGTDPLSQQSAMLAGQEVGMGTANNVSAKFNDWVRSFQ